MRMAHGANPRRQLRWHDNETDSLTLLRALNIENITAKRRLITLR